MTVKRHQTHFDVTARDGTSAALQAVEKNLLRVQRAADTMGRTFGTVLGATAAITFGRAVARELLEAEQASNRLAAVIRATGSAAGYTKQQLEDMANKLSSSTQFTDEAFVNAQAALLKFGNIQGKVFEDGLRLSADLAAFMGTDVPEAAQLIGKSLQSPTEGLSMMELQFGKLTEAERVHIDTLVSQGDAIGAQIAVLELWQKKIGGTAGLMNTGLKAATDGLTKSWGRLLEEFGRTATEAGLVERRLRGIAEILDHIRESSKPATAGETRVATMNRLQEEIERIERSRPATRRSPLVDARLAELRGELMALNAAGMQERRLMQAQRQQAEFAASLAAGQRPIDLGGKKPAGDRSAAAAKSAEAARRWREEIAILQRQEQADVDALLRAEEDMAAGSQIFSDASIEPYVEAAEKITELGDSLVYTWDEAGNRVELTKSEFEKLIETQQESDKVTRDATNAAREFGMTFQSSLEDAILKGGELSDVVKALEQDIARMIIRMTVIEPIMNSIRGGLGGGGWGGLGAAIGSWLGGELFGGGVDDVLASEYIPRYASGTDYVPRDGLAYLHKGEAVIPEASNRGGAVTYAPVSHVVINGSGLSQRELEAAVENAMARERARNLRDFRYNGPMRRALDS